MMVNTKIRLIIFFAGKGGGESLYSQETRMGADCGSNHELLIEKFRQMEASSRSDLAAVAAAGETTRQFMYDLNQIP